MGGEEWIPKLLKQLYTSLLQSSKTLTTFTVEPIYNGLLCDLQDDFGQTSEELQPSLFCVLDGGSIAAEAAPQGDLLLHQHACAHFDVVAHHTGNKVAHQGT